jgi:hypothetical protein
MARLNVRLVSELSGETVAIDDRYSAYNRSVRSAIEAGERALARIPEKPKNQREYAVPVLD